MTEFTSFVDDVFHSRYDKVQIGDLIMKFGKFAAFAAAASLVASPVLAQSANKLAPAQTAKVERVAAKTEEVNKLGGENGVLIGVLAFAAVVGGVFLVADSSEPDNSVSP